MLPTIATGNVGSALAGEYEVANSLRFDDGSSDYLTRTPSSAGNRRTFSFSAWIKRGSNLGSNQVIYDGGATNPTTTIRFSSESSSDDKLNIFHYSGSFTTQVVTNREFRDTSAWYHIVVAFDTTQATSSNRIKVYVNGVQETSFATATYPSQDFDTEINNNSIQTIGSVNGGGDLFDGYMSEVVVVDGQALAPTSFGEFDSDTGIWKPIDVSGLTFGTNGFYLDFENSGSLGADVSGNGNNFTVNNLTSIDQTTDTCTNNFATMNPLQQSSSITYSNGNTTFTNTSSGHRSVVSTFALSSGKWYAEVKIGSLGAAYPTFGIFEADANFNSSTYFTITSSGWGYNSNGHIFNNNAAVVTGLSTWTTNDIIGIALDVDSNKIYFSKNGTWQNSADPAAGSNGQSITSDKTWYFAGHTNDGGTDPIQNFNFGNPPYSISSGNADGNGYGNFEYSVPSAYYSLCTKNLAEYG